MPYHTLYHTLDEWQNLLKEDLQKPAEWKSSAPRLHQILCDFEEWQYPEDSRWGDPLLQVVKDWVIHTRVLFSHARLLSLDIIQDGNHYQRVGDWTVRLSEKLGLPQLHPGYAPIVSFSNRLTVKFQVVQRLATWQTPETHRACLAESPGGWSFAVKNGGLAAAWPLFLHYLQWGIVPAMEIACVDQLLNTPAKWQALSVEGSFTLWSYLQRAVQARVAVDAWRNWVTTLPAEHAAHTLDVPRAFQVYNLWATLLAPGQPPNWLTLVQMLEPAPNRVPTEIGPVADLTL